MLSHHNYLALRGMRQPDAILRQLLGHRESNPRIGVPAAPVEYLKAPSCMGFRVLGSRLVPSNPTSFAVTFGGI
jgi:hypothetical protein